MSECGWPEQDAIDKWLDEHFSNPSLFALKEAVTAPRLKLQDDMVTVLRRISQSDSLEECRELANKAIVQIYGGEG